MKFRRLGERGFTLIELVMIIALLAILAATAIIYNPLDSIRIDSAARKLKEDIRYARKLAVTTQSRSGVTFNANGYIMYHSLSSATVANATGEPCSSRTDGKFEVDYTATRCSQFDGVTLTYSTATVGFDYLGRPVDSSGSLIDTQTVTVSGSRTISITNGTGRVSG